MTPAHRAFIGFFVALSCPAAGRAQVQVGPGTPGDSAAIRRAALDYIEGWFTADSVRMRRAVHTQLAKRIAVTDPTAGRTRLSQTSADRLVDEAGRGGGSNIPTGRRLAEVRILAIDGGMATVRLLSTQLIDYMHLARVDGEWKIINVLWDFRRDAQP